MAPQPSPNLTVHISTKWWSWMWWRRLKWRLWSSTSFRRCWRDGRNEKLETHWLQAQLKKTIETLHLAIISMKRPLSLVADQVMAIDCEIADDLARTFFICMRRSRREWKFTKRRVRAVNAKRSFNWKHLQTTFDFNYRWCHPAVEIASFGIKLSELISRVEPEFAYFWEFNRRIAHFNELARLATNRHLLVMQLAVIAKLECDDTEWMSLWIHQSKRVWKRKQKKKKLGKRKQRK